MGSITSKEMMQKNAENTNTKQLECSICLEGIKATNMAETVCHHFFHADCLATWQPQNKTCPMCRRLF